MSKNGSKSEARAGPIAADDSQNYACDQQQLKAASADPRHTKEGRGTLGLSDQEG